MWKFSVNGLPLGSIGLIINLFAGSLCAENDRPPAPELPQQLSPLDGTIDPVTGEVLETFEPKTPRGAKDARKTQALARYLAGRVELDRRNFDRALAEFLKSVELNPQALEGYQAVVPLLFAQDRAEEAQAYALQAARSTPEGFKLAIGVAGQYASRRQFDVGINLLKKTLAQGKYQTGTREHLVLNRDLGLFYRLAGQIEDAAKYYQVVLETVLDQAVDEATQKEIFEDPAKNFDEFGDTFLKANQPELALKAFEQATKYREAKPGLHSFNLATVFQQTGKPDQALEALQQYLDAQLQGRGVAAYILLEKILKDLGREQELIGKLEELLSKDEFNDVLRFFLADKVLSAGNREHAKELYLKNSEEVADPRAMVGMLNIYRAEGNSEKLLALLSKAFQVIPRPEDPADLENLGDDLRDLAQSFDREIQALEEDQAAMDGLYAQARKLAKSEEPQLDFVQAYLLGKLATEADDTAPAIEFYRLAIGMRNDPPFQLYRELGSYLIDVKDYKTAIEILNEALTHPSNSLQSQRWFAAYFLSYAYEYDGQTEKALEAVDEARGSAPDGALGILLSQKAWIYTHAHNYEQALNYYHQVLAEFPNDKKLVQDAKFTLSTIYVEQKDMEKGEQELLDILKQGPYDEKADARANNDLGYLWADQGKNLDKAKEMIKKALDSEPDNPAYLDSYGWVLYRLEDFSGAVEYLRKATEQKHGDDSTIFDHLGDALLKHGDEAEAQANFEKALKIEEEKDHPNDELIQTLRAKLSGIDQSSQSQ